MSASSNWDATPRGEQIQEAPVDPITSAFDLGLEQLSSLSIRKPKRLEKFKI